MQVGQFGSLRDYAAKAPVQDGAFADTIRQKGQEIIKNALTAYSDPKRTREAGDAAVDDLTDLERAIKQVVDRTKAETAANSGQIDSVVAGLNQTGVADGKLRAAFQKSISSPAETALPGFTMTSGADGLTAGRLQHAPETAAAVRPTVDKMEGLAAFIGDLHGVAGLYSAAVAAGPPTLTVANFAREESEASNHEQSSSSVSGSSSDRAAYGLGLFGIRNAHSQFSGAAQASADGSYMFDKTSTDERIVPVLRDLIERLDQASVYPAQHATVNAHQAVSGVRIDMKKEHWWSDAKPVESNIQWYSGRSWAYSADVVRPVASEAYEPSHLKLPLTGVSDYQAK